MSKSEIQKIRFHYLIKPFYFPGRNTLKFFLLTQLNKEGRAVEAISYIFCSDEYLLQLNQSYLGHDTYTDIITFELSNKTQPLIADIYISIDRVRNNASKFNKSFRNELYRVFFHGALHLLGFSDKKVQDLKKMRTAEDAWIKSYLVSRNTVS